MINALIRYLFKRERVFRLPRGLITRFDETLLTEDDRLIIARGRAKSPHDAQRLMQTYGVDNAVQLLEKLPARRKPSLKKRLYTFFCRLEGTYPYDPAKSEMRRYLKKPTPKPLRLKYRYNKKSP